MNGLRRIHVAACVNNALSLVLALFAPRLGIVVCFVTTLLVLWSAERLRVRSVTRPWENRP